MYKIHVSLLSSNHLNQNYFKTSKFNEFENTNKVVKLKFVEMSSYPNLKRNSSSKINFRYFKKEIFFDFPFECK